MTTPEPTQQEAEGGSAPAIDPLHSASDPDTMWSTTNAAEALPGVPTPLSWTIWSSAAELAIRRVFHRLGALSKREVVVPAAAEERMLSIFYGHPALRIGFFQELGDRFPGTSGAAMVQQLFAVDLPDELAGGPQRRYYPLVAARFPFALLGVPILVRRARKRMRDVWPSELDRIATADRDAAQQLVCASADNFAENLYWQTLAVFAVVQPAFDQLSRLVDVSGEAAPGLMAGYGSHAETEMVVDLWRCSRGTIDLPTFLDLHGYHGPDEGELSTTSWRENPKPVLQLLDGYRSMDDTADPVLGEMTRIAERQRLEQQLLQALPAIRRPWARAILTLAKRSVPMRAVGKVAFLQSLDLTRAAARRLGTCLVDDGVLENREDVFFLTEQEIRTGRWHGLRDEIRVRRERHAAYQLMEIPVSWTGAPEGRNIADEQQDGPTAPGVVRGLGASPGVVEGTIRVIHDPTDLDMDVGDILVARTTDPSWASIMFMSGALVTDVGGLLSHTAVIARELGIPCVVDTKVGTRSLRDGDRCRVDGRTGEVEILGRAVTRAGR